jgi:hypothetical protein
MQLHGENISEVYITGHQDPVLPQYYLCNDLVYSVAEEEEVVRRTARTLVVFHKKELSEWLHLYNTLMLEQYGGGSASHPEAKSTAVIN